MSSRHSSVTSGLRRVRTPPAPTTDVVSERGREQLEAGRGERQ
jgi:hypothetical protein